MPRKRKAITEKSVQSTEDKPFDLPQVEHKAESDNCPWDDNRLTLKERRFVHFYLGQAAGNATSAAELAGYNANNRVTLAVTASEILRKPYVQQHLEQEIGKGFGSPEQITRSLATIAQGAAAFLVKREDGQWGYDLDAMAAAGLLGLVKELEVDEVKIADSPAVVVKQKIKLYDRMKALELLAKINGQFIERRELTSGGKPIQFTLKVEGERTDAPRITTSSN